MNETSHTCRDIKNQEFHSVVPAVVEVRRLKLRNKWREAHGISLRNQTGTALNSEAKPSSLIMREHTAKKLGA